MIYLKISSSGGSARIYFQEHGVCRFIYDEHIEQIAPGETDVTTVPGTLSALWLGPAYIESDVPLGIVVDQTSLARSRTGAFY